MTTIRLNDQQAPDRRRSPRAVLVPCLSAGLALTLVAATSASADARPAPSLDQAKKALLVASDFPSGWTSSKASNDNSSFPGATQLARCLGIPKSIVTDNPPTANSDDFDSSDKLESVSDSVSVYPSAKAAQADYGSLANAKTPSCLTQVLNGSARRALASQFGAGASLGNILVSRSPASAFAPGSANFIAFMPITTHGVTLNFALSVVDYVKGRTEQTVIMTSIQAPFPAALGLHLTTVALGRL